MKTLWIDGHEVAADALLAALHNRSSARGMGVIHDIGRDLTRAEAAALFSFDDTRFAFDYYKGRPIKCFEHKMFVGDAVRCTVDGGLYDRDNGPGAFDEAVLDALTMPELKT